MRYILNEQYCLCGYKNLPFALYNKVTGKTNFFTREEYSLLLDCDGQTDISVKDLNDKDKEIFRSFVEGGLVRISDKESLDPDQEYHQYDVYRRDGIQFSITGRCNYRCKHCFMSAPHARYDEMSLDDCITVIRKLKECGIRVIQLTGGEPLAHPDFKKIVEEISRQGLHLQMLYTNGLLLKQDILDLFKKLHQNPKIQISFDGLGYHDWMRGVKNAEKYAVDALKLCVKNGFECEAAMVIFKDNIDSLADTVRFLDGLGVSMVRVSNVYNQGEWLAYADEHGLSVEEVFDKYLEYIPVYLKDDLKISISLGGFFRYDAKEKKAMSTFENRCTEDNKDKYVLCKSIRQAFYISSTGFVLPCTSMLSTRVEDNALNMLEHDLKDIINDSYLYEIGNLKAKDFLEKNKKCNECKYRYQCLGGCRARALILQDDMFGNDSDVCTYFLDGFKEKKDRLLDELHVERY
ncbi:MAG: radical SAM protein [Erysipelotrichaceae bacterium]|nr:radical SAM protein [Erysipelotrichaceae bacterium]